MIPSRFPRQTLSKRTLAPVKGHSPSFILFLYSPLSYSLPSIYGKQRSRRGREAGINRKLVYLQEFLKSHKIPVIPLDPSASFTNTSISWSFLTLATDTVTFPFRIHSVSFFKYTPEREGGLSNKDLLEWFLGLKHS